MTPEEFKKVCEEYDAAPDDFGWDEDHPIFCLAQENDTLKAMLNTRCANCQQKEGSQ